VKISDILEEIDDRHAEGRVATEPDKELSWGRFGDPFIEQLTDYVRGRRVLEVFAGNGLLAKKLTDKGVSVKATSEFTGHDYHRLGFHHDVEELEAAAAVKRYSDESDILLMSWPPPTEHALRASILWGSERPIVFIGEVTKVETLQLGGCASDLFFELTDEDGAFDAYEGNVFDRAAVRNVNPARLAMWMDALRNGTEYEPRYRYPEGYKML
jgi:hypothetical protein